MPLGKPLTKEETDEVIKNTEALANQDGIWEKICLKCGEVIGGRLASYGKPTDYDLSMCACPNCGGEDARTELWKGSE